MSATRYNAGDHVDRRKSHRRVSMEIRAHAETTIFARRNLTFAGWSRPGDYSGRIERI